METSGVPQASRAGDPMSKPSLIAVLCLALLHFLLWVREAAIHTYHRILEYSTPLSRVIRRILLSSAQHGSGGTQPRTAQRGKVPPIPTVVAVILADDGAVSVDPDKLADVVSWVGQHGTTTVFLYHPLGISEALQTAVATALEHKLGDEIYSFRAAYQRQPAASPAALPSMVLLPEPDSLPGLDLHADGSLGCREAGSRFAGSTLAGVDGGSLSTEVLGLRCRGGGQQSVHQPGGQHVSSSSQSTDQHVDVLTLSASDASWPLIEAAKLSQQHRSAEGERPLPPDSAGNAGEPAMSVAQPGARLVSGLVAVAGPAASLEPHLVLVFGQFATLAGFPPWPVRFSEIYLAGHLSAITNSRLDHCWRQYYGTSQRFGV